MPFYDYTCLKCGTFALLRNLEDRNLPARCPGCQAHAKRALSAPHLSLMSAPRRQAFTRNEKSRHEPGVSTRHRCSSGCGCSSSSSASRAKSTRTVDLGKVGKFEAPQKIKRPWMLGH
jgi:putative FmdB family regulatory protein